MRGDERLTPGGWCAARLTLDGRPLTVLMIDHPANPRPARWFTMSQPFCYLAAALNLEAEPRVLKAGDSWPLRYTLAVLSSPADHARLAALAADCLRTNVFSVIKPVAPARP